MVSGVMDRISNLILPLQCTVHRFVSVVCSEGLCRECSELLKAQVRFAAWMHTAPCTGHCMKHLKKQAW